MSIWNMCQPCHYREPFSGEMHANCPICGNVMVMSDDFGNESKPDESAREIMKSNLEFPSHIISGAAGTFASVYSDVLESPIQFFYIAYLTCLGSAISTKVSISNELYTQPRLFTLILGESADDRKSTAINKTLDLFDGMINPCMGVGSAEGLQKVLESKQSAILCLDEFKAFVGKATIQSSVLLPCVNTLFESNRYSNVTQKTDIDIKDAHLSMLAASTVDTYERTWCPEFTDIGFNNRLFIVPGTADRKHFAPPKIDQEVRNEIKSELYSIIGRCNDGLSIEMTDDAKDVMQGWYRLGERSEYTKRIEGYATRLMILLAINDGLHVITENIARRVVELVNWQIIVRRRFDPIDADNEMAKMEMRIRRIVGSLNGNTIQEGTLKKKCHYERSGVYIFNSALRNLEANCEIASTGVHGSKKWFMVAEEKQ